MFKKYLLIIILFVCIAGHSMFGSNSNVQILSKNKSASISSVEPRISAADVPSESPYALRFNEKSTRNTSEYKLRLFMRTSPFLISPQRALSLIRSNYVKPQKVIQPSARRTKLDGQIALESLRGHEKEINDTLYAWIHSMNDDKDIDGEIEG